MHKPFKDGVTPRLFLVAEKHLDEKIKWIKEKKQGIWLIQTNQTKWLIKEYRTLRHLQLQHKLITYLKVYGFSYTYDIQSTPIQIDNRVFGFIEYIEANPRNFHYKKDAHIFDAFALIHQFHLTTAQFYEEFPEVPTFHLFDKWSTRFIRFEKWLLTSTFQSNPFLQKMIEYGKWSLSKMEKDQCFLLDKRQCITHGDVAHHNFLKKKNGELYLIDFDLVHAGAAELDYLQLANRVLPGLRWDFDRLFQIPEIMQLKESSSFLCALVYPTDVYRECLYHGDQNPEYVSHVLSLQNERIAFYERIKSSFHVYE